MRKILPLLFFLSFFTSFSWGQTLIVDPLEGLPEYNVTSNEVYKSIIVKTGGKLNVYNGALLTTDTLIVQGSGTTEDSIARMNNYGNVVVNHFFLNSYANVINGASELTTTVYTVIDTAVHQEYASFENYGIANIPDIVFKSFEAIVCKYENYGILNIKKNCIYEDSSLVVTIRNYLSGI